MAKGKGKIQGWITKNGVHIPIYDHYTVREGHEPGENGLKSKFKKPVKKQQEKHTYEDIKKDDTEQLRNSIEKDIKSKMETHWKWAGEDKDRFATTDTKSVMTRVDTMLDHFKGKDIITPGEDSEVPGEIKWKFTGRDKNTGKRASFDFSEAPNPEKAKESLRKNGYQVSSYNIYPEQIYNYLFNHTNVDDYDKMAAQALSKQALSDWRKKTSSTKKKTSSKSTPVISSKDVDSKVAGKFSQKTQSKITFAEKDSYGKYHVVVEDDTYGEASFHDTNFQNLKWEIQEFLKNGTRY